MTYAEKTEVAPERSRAEIERTLNRYGADSFAYVSAPDRGAVAFRMEGRAVRFEVPLPTDPAEFRRTKGGQTRTSRQMEAALEAEVRRRWRALLLCLKGKLEAVESGITTFEEEFLAHLVLPSGATVGQAFAPELARADEAGVMPDFRAALALGPG